MVVVPFMVNLESDYYMRTKCICVLSLLMLTFCFSCRQEDESIQNEEFIVKKRKSIELVRLDFESRYGKIFDDEHWASNLSDPMKTDTLVFVIRHKIPDSLRISPDDSMLCVNVAYVVDTAGFREIDFDSMHIIVNVTPRDKNSLNYNKE